MRDEWKYVLMEDGELYLMMVGQLLMLELFAESWAIHFWVNKCYLNHKLHTCTLLQCIYMYMYMLKKLCY